MRPLLLSTDAELSEVERQIEQLSRRRDGLRQIKEGIENYLAAWDEGDEPNGLATPPAPPVRTATVPHFGPRGREAVAQILRESPNTPMTASQVAEEIERRHWIDPGGSAIDATRTALLRALKHYREVHRPATGVYVWREPDRAPNGMDDGSGDRESDLADLDKPPPQGSMTGTLAAIGLLASLGAISRKEVA